MSRQNALLLYELRRDGSWKWTGPMVGDPAADRMVDPFRKAYEHAAKAYRDGTPVCIGLTAGMVIAVEIRSSPPVRKAWGTEARIDGYTVRMGPPRSRELWRTDGGDASAGIHRNEGRVFTARQRQAYLAMHGQWHFRRALDVAHVGGHETMAAASTDPDPATGADMERAIAAIGPLYVRTGGDMWIEVTPIRERDRHAEENYPARQPDIDTTERDIQAARKLRPSVERSLTDPESRRLMERIQSRLGIGERPAGRIIEVARSIAALDRSTVIAPAHLAEAVQYSPPDWRSRKNPAPGHEVILAYEIQPDGNWRWSGRLMESPAIADSLARELAGLYAELVSYDLSDEETAAIRRMEITGKFTHRGTMESVRWDFPRLTLFADGESIRPRIVGKRRGLTVSVQKRISLSPPPPPPAEDSFWGEPISVYTRAQAIADGVLVDLSEQFPEICRQHYKLRIAATSAVWALVEAASRSGSADHAGVVHDMLFMSRHRHRKIDNSTVLFDVTIKDENGRNRLRKLKLAVGPGDRGEPVITVMLPEED